MQKLIPDEKLRNVSVLYTFMKYNAAMNTTWIENMQNHFEMVYYDGLLVNPVAIVLKSLHCD